MRAAESVLENPSTPHPLQPAVISPINCPDLKAAIELFSLMVQKGMI